MPTQQCLPWDAIDAWLSCKSSSEMWGLPEPEAPVEIDFHDEDD